MVSWSALFDKTHILKGVPADAEIELKCKKCKTLFRTLNAYYIGYSEIHYINPNEQSKCSHDLKSLEPTNNWFPTRDIHNQMSGGSWASIFDYSHIIEGVPVDTDIELKCKRCNTLIYTKNAYYVGYSEICYVNSEEEEKCNHDIKNLKPTKRFFPDSVGK